MNIGSQILTTEPITIKQRLPTMRSRQTLLNFYNEYQANKSSKTKSEWIRYFNISPTTFSKWQKNIPPKVAKHPNKANQDTEPSLVISNNIPSKDEIYFLLVQGYSIQHIAHRLNKPLESIANTKAYFLKEGIIKPQQMNADLSMQEIGLILGMNESKVRSLYKSGLKKIMDAIGDVNDLVSEPIEDENFRNVGNDICSKRYSVLM